VSDPGNVAETSKMADLLSAATLLLTVVGVVYGTWYAEIISAIDVGVPAHAADRGPVRRRVRSALYAKALPLAIAAVILTLLFLPDALVIISSKIHWIRTVGLKALSSYNAVKAAFCFVVLLTGFLAGYLLFLVHRLRAKLQEIDTP